MQTDSLHYRSGTTLSSLSRHEGNLILQRREKPSSEHSIASPWNGCPASIVTTIPTPASPVLVM